MKAVILAGGVGTRLWPMSRSSRPKQFYDVVGEEPLIQDTYRRLLRLFDAEQIYFSISPAFDHFIHTLFPEVPAHRIFIEPEKRDTGPAMGYVAALLELEDPDEPIVFIPSDHYIQDEEVFLKSLEIGDQLIRQTGKLLDIAITPTFPSTVLGYTKIGANVETIDGIAVYQFAGHTEKPVYEIAKAYLEDGSYLWHANYYMWTPRKFMEAFDQYVPQMGSCLREIQRSQGEDVVNWYRQLPKISFDYAVTEKMHAEDVLIIKGDFGWSDIGAWDTLHERLSETLTPPNLPFERGGVGNVTKGNCVLLDTNRSLVYAPKDKLVAVIGMEDVIVVDTGDALLVCKKEDAQRVKEIVTYLTEHGLDQHV